MPSYFGRRRGVITVIYFAIYGHTYGRTHLGSIQAAVQVFMVLSSTTGPLVLAAYRAHFGNTMHSSILLRQCRPGWGR